MVTGCGQATVAVVPVVEATMLAGHAEAAMNGGAVSASAGASSSCKQREGLGGGKEEQQ